MKPFKLHWITLYLKTREMYDLYVKDKNMKMTPYPCYYAKLDPHEKWTPLVGRPFLTGESSHEKWTPPRIRSCLNAICLIFHLSMKVMDNADMFKPKLIINFSCTLKAQGGICVHEISFRKKG